MTARHFLATAGVCSVSLLFPRPASGQDDKATIRKKQILELIRNHMLDVRPELKRAELAADKGMAALGLDSVDRAEVLIMTMEVLNIKVRMVEMASAKSIWDLAVLFFDTESKAGAKP